MREAVDFISLWAIPFLLVSIPLYGMLKKVKVYEAFIDGAGSVYDFRVVSLPPQYPAGFPSLKTELANSLLTSRFEPATSFGLPVRGKVLISFRPGTHVTVQG